MKYLPIILLIAQPIYAQELTGPAYAAAKKRELQALQRRNAARRAANPKMVGPRYAAAKKRQLRNVQKNNSHDRGAVGPVYAAQVENTKRFQRVWNGTWHNNTYWFSRRTVTIKPGTRNTPTFRRLNDPWTWHGQQYPAGWWQRRY